MNTDKQIEEYYLQKRLKSERYFLQGPQRPHRELRSAWKILLETVKGYWHLRNVGPCVTVFGSARFDENNKYYQMARELGAGIAHMGMNVITGGGPGIMEAANRGAKEAGGTSIGCNIVLPHEQHQNPYLDHSIEFNYFFVRKLMLIKYSYAFVVMPGGFGTLDEVFETLTLIQTGKIQNFPVVAMGTDFWKHFRDFIKNGLLAQHTINREDLDLVYVTDSPADAVKYIEERVVLQHGFVRNKKP
ncbi:TIGR00730 family Rossman fold protein [Rapidithrix thailandica]|uniref:Cytokinin riboside 5'-monophosphate phosphoribohydrolase n=1 Tax=Rapidithrix thailandica TaxID=413964 RepID=A0AAW9S558_9BACT